MIILDRELPESYVMEQYEGILTFTIPFGAFDNIADTLKKVNQCVWQQRVHEVFEFITDKSEQKYIFKMQRM